MKPLLYAPRLLRVFALTPLPQHIHFLFTPSNFRFYALWMAALYYVKPHMFLYFYGNITFNLRPLFQAHNEGVKQKHGVTLTSLNRAVAAQRDACLADNGQASAAVSRGRHVTRGQQQLSTAIFRSYPALHRPGLSS
jgi:hypothetical protein